MTDKNTQKFTKTTHLDKISGKLLADISTRARFDEYPEIEKIVKDFMPVARNAAGEGYSGAILVDGKSSMIHNRKVLLRLAEEMESRGFELEMDEKTKDIYAVWGDPTNESIIITTPVSNLKAIAHEYAQMQCKQIIWSKCLAAAKNRSNNIRVNMSEIIFESSCKNTHTSNPVNMSGSAGATTNSKFVGLDKTFFRVVPDLVKDLKNSGIETISNYTTLAESHTEEADLLCFDFSWYQNTQD